MVPSVHSKITHPIPTDPDHLPFSRGLAGVWLLLSIALLIIGGYLAWDIYSHHQQIKSDEQERLQKRVGVIEQNLERQLLTIDRSLVALRADLPSLMARNDNNAALTRRLHVIHEAVPGARTLLVVNGEGVCVASNRPELVGTNFRDADRYKLMSADPDPDKLFMAPPFISPLKTFVTSAGKVVLDEQRRFAGYVLAIIDPDFFNTLLTSLIFAPDMRVAVLHGDGKVIVRVPDPQQLIGTDQSRNQSFFSRHLESGQRESLYYGESAIIGERRMTLFRDMRPASMHLNKPLVIAASREISALFTNWRYEMALHAALFTLLLLVSVSGLLYFQSRQRTFDLLAAAKEAKRRHAEDSLRQSEEHLAITLRSIGDAVIVTDTAGNITQMNPSAEHLTGWRFEAARGQSLASVFHIINSVTREAVDDPVQKVLAGGEVVALANHTALIAQDGREYQISDSAAPIRDRAGKVVGVVLVFSNVTEQYAAHRKLRQRELLLKTLTDRAHIGMVMVNRDNRYVFANEAYARALGHKVEDLLGRQVGSVWPHLYESAFRMRIELAFAGEGSQFDIAIPSMPDCPGERHINISVEAAVETEFGATVIILATDISERVRAEALRVRLAAAVESSNDAIFVRDLDFRIVYWNKAAERLYGYTAEEVLGKVDAYQLSADDARKRQAIWDSLLRGESVENFDALRGRKDGTKVHVSISAAPVNDNDGRIIGIVTVARDISESMRAHNAVAESRAKLHAALEGMSDAVFISDSEARLVEFNEAFAAIHRFRSKSECARTLAEYPAFLDVYTMDGRLLPLEEWAVARALRGETGTNAEYRLRRKDTGETWIGSYTFAPIRDADGTITGAVVTGRDVTERKRAEEALTRLAAIIEQSQDAIISRKLDGEILSWNDAAEKMFGYTAAEAVGRNIAFTLEAGNPGRLEQNNEAVVHGGVLIRESRRRTRDGRIITIRGSYSALRDASGQVVGVSQILQDITAQREVESARARLAQIIESSNDAIISRNLDGIILSWNSGAEKMFGYSAAEAVGKHIEVVLPTDIPSNVQANNDTVVRGDAFIRETNRTTRNGRVITVQGSYSPLRDSSGKVVGVSLIMHDVTALKQAEAARIALEAQLREAQKMQAIGTLAGGIAHDFNNIIATIMGNAELALEDVQGNARATDSLNEIHKATRRARDLVQQILSFSRRQPATLKRIPLEPVVMETVRLLRSTIPKRISLDVRCGEAPEVVGDATQIQQIIINLATNALQAMPEGNGRVRIALDRVELTDTLVAAHPALHDLKARVDAPAACICVSDTGTGMDAATLSRIFEPFFTTKPVNAGTGLGLSVVHGIVEGHGGAISVESELGKGSRFCVYLPAAHVAAPAGRATTQRMKVGLRTTGDGLRVLYVDDDELLVNLTARTLERRGFVVSAHSNQREALDLLRAGPDQFDIVLTDYNMPEISGLDVAREVRRIRPTLPVVVTSGFIDDTLLAQAKDAGVSELISKVDSPEELCGVMLRVTGRAP